MNNSRKVYSTRTGQGQRHFKTKRPAIAAMHAVHNAAQQMQPPTLPALPTLPELADTVPTVEEEALDLSRHNGLGWIDSEDGE